MGPQEPAEGYIMIACEIAVDLAWGLSEILSALPPPPMEQPFHPLASQPLLPASPPLHLGEDTFVSFVFSYAVLLGREFRALFV